MPGKFRGEDVELGAIAAVECRLRSEKIRIRRLGRGRGDGREAGRGQCQEPGRNGQHRDHVDIVADGTPHRQPVRRTIVKVRHETVTRRAGSGSPNDKIH